MKRVNGAGLKHAFALAGRSLAAILVTFSVLTYFVSLVIGPILFFTTSDGLKVASQVVHSLPLFVLLLTVDLPISASVGALFICFWIFFLVSLLLAWQSGDGFKNSLREFSIKPISIGRTSFLVIMPLVATALISATVLLQNFQEAQGVQTGNLNYPPSTSPYVILIGLALASLREELGFRMIPIGLPLALYLLIVCRNTPELKGVLSRLKIAAVSLYSPEMAKVLAGYRTVAKNGFWRGITLFEWILILLTSALFGLAHFLSGSGWEIGKISTAFLAGFVFGLMFVVYGAYAAILLHWFFDYFFTVFDMAATTYGGAFNVFSNLLVYVNLTGGQVVLVVFLLLGAYRLANYLTLRSLGLSAQSKDQIA